MLARSLAKDQPSPGDSCVGMGDPLRGTNVLRIKKRSPKIVKYYTCFIMFVLPGTQTLQILPENL
jgi:hypothetical protein